MPITMSSNIDFADTSADDQINTTNSLKLSFSSNERFRKVTRLFSKGSSLRPIQEIKTLSDTDSSSPKCHARYLGDSNCSEQLSMPECMSEPNDHLHLSENLEFLKFLAVQDNHSRQILYSGLASKINRRERIQERILVVTNSSILNILPGDQFKCKRVIQLENVESIYTADKVRQFVVHVNGEYDYHYFSPHLREIVDVIAQAVFDSRLRTIYVIDMWAPKSLAALKNIITTKPVAKLRVETARKLIGGNSMVGSLRKIFFAKENAQSKSDNDETGEANENSEFADLKKCSRSRMKRLSQAGDLIAQDISDQSVFARPDSQSQYGQDDFTPIQTVGRGAFGKVTLVREKRTGNLFAMKTLQKKMLLERDQIRHSKSERHILEDVRHPFLVNLRFAFQTPQKLFLVMDFVGGGELFFHLRNEGVFDEARSRFYAAEITLALSHLHSKHIIFRDLKPENILVDYQGHLRLTDFGLCKEAMGVCDQTYTLCGTPEYLAPEILKNHGYGKDVDWWSLGFLLYEMLLGRPPFYGENHMQLFNRILRGKLTFQTAGIAISDSAKSILKKLMEKDPKNRLGCGAQDGAQIQAHEFFKGMDWDSLYHKKVQPPWRPPETSGPADTKNFDTAFTEQPVVDSPVSSDDEGTTEGEQTHQRVRTWSNFSFNGEADTTTTGSWTAT